MLTEVKYIMSMDDLIRRQDVLVRLEVNRPATDKDSDRQRARFAQWQADREAVMSVAAQPGRKTGEWVRMSDADGEYYCCNQCGEDLNRYMMETPSYNNPYPHKYSIDKTNFCPNCGALMSASLKEDGTE
jgi:hypothetical protein